MSHTGTNDYNSQKLLPSETIVSRTLQSKNRFWTNVIWRTGKPALDSEWNLINDMATESIANLIRSSSQSGWIDLGRNKFSYNSAISNNFQFYSNSKEDVLDVPNAIINGWPLVIGGVNYTDTSINSINLPAASGTSRYDFVFLEAWRTIVRSRDSNNNPIQQNKPSLTEIYAYGNTQFGGTQLPDDLVDSTIKPSVNGIETSERVQLQYRIRVVPNVSFTTTLSSGFEGPIVQGQGANPTPQVVGYQFTNMGTELNDSGLWRAGNGDQASQTALHSVDGYSYAIPMFKVFRRSTIAYSDSGIDAPTAYNNQQGNSAILSGISDRPDGKFNDGIDSTDITDLRLKTSLSSLNFSDILEYNLHLLLKGDLESVRETTLQYDSINDIDINGYTDFRSNEGASGKRTLWSDTSSDQTSLFSRITIGSTDNSQDVYIIKVNPSPNWDSGDQIIVQKVTKLPTGTTIKATPIIYVEKEDPLSTTGPIGTWAGLGTSIATYTISSDFGNNKNLWIYYDMNIPAGQGLTHPAKQLQQIKYVNFSAFSEGVIVRGETIYSRVNRFQDLANHPYQNTIGSTVYNEIITVNQRKEVNISPLVQTTTVKNGSIRSMDVRTTNALQLTVTVPYPIQHLKGIYTSATGGTEVATIVTPYTQISSLNISNNSFIISSGNYIAEMTSLQYDPTAAFVGAQTELLIAGTPTGLYNPVFQHTSAASSVKLYKTDGTIYTIPGSASAINFRWAGRRIKVRGGSGAGYDINEKIIDCTGSTNSGLFSGFSNGQQLWIDMDYFGAPHKGAEVRIIYSYSPYQGLDIGDQELSLVHKRETGIYFNNGTGGGLINDTLGTSSEVYTPISPKLPGALSDYRRDGSLIDISSKGTKRYNSDLWMSAAYDVYGYWGGGSLWSNDYIMPALPTPSARGFLTSPMLEVIFELPTQDQTYAEFVLVLLVKDKNSNELYLLVQIGQKGVQKSEVGNVYIELYRLNEKMLIK